MTLFIETEKSRELNANKYDKLNECSVLCGDLNDHRHWITGVWCAASDSPDSIDLNYSLNMGIGPLLLAFTAIVVFKVSEIIH